MTSKLDLELISALTLVMSDRLKIILDLIPKQKEYLLKHLASASIHLAFFMRDMLEDIDGKKSPMIENEQQFMNECGCKDEND